jgi:hypothetical protein
MIAIKYLKTWFIFDLVSVIPLEFISQQDNIMINKMARFLRIGKIYKLVRITKFTRLIRSLRVNTTLIR